MVRLQGSHFYLHPEYYDKNNFTLSVPLNSDAPREFSKTLVEDLISF